MDDIDAFLKSKAMGPVVYILGQGSLSESIIKAYGEHGNPKKYP